MTDPLAIKNPVFTDAVGSPKPEDLLPTGPGVSFTTPTGSIKVTFADDKTPILGSVTGPTKNTNVVSITVTITRPDGSLVVPPITSKDGNKVVDLPVTPLPAGSSVTVTPTTKDGQPAVNVTLSVIACITPSTAATVVSTGVTTATIVSTGTGTEKQTTLVITTTAPGTSTGMSSTKR